jgi:hypothetical protein
MLDELEDKTSTKRRVGRDDESLLMRRKILDLAEFTRDTLPDNPVAFIVSLILVGLNILAEAFFFFELLIRTPEAIGSKPAIFPKNQASDSSSRSVQSPDQSRKPGEQMPTPRPA